MSISLKIDFSPFVQLSHVLNRNWILVFHQNISVGLFDKPESALISLKNGMYSILSEIKEDWKINGKFEFMLDYPELGKRNIWRQSLNPIDDYEETRPNERTAVGYEGVSIEMTEQGWGGLVRSSTAISLLDGSVNYLIEGFNRWYYSVGTCFLQNNGIPSNNNPVNNVYLWIRFNSIKFIPQYEMNSFLCSLGAVLIIPFT